MHRASLEPNLAAGMLRRADLNPNRTALIFEGQEILFGEFADRVRRQATVLHEGGVCMGLGGKRPHGQDLESRDGQVA